MKRILILGGGFGGLAAAKELKDALGKDVEVVVVDKRDRTDFRPSYLYVMIGYREPHQVSAPLTLLERRGGLSLLRRRSRQLTRQIGLLKRRLET